MNFSSSFQSLTVAMVCFLAGFLIDVDHVLEYIIHYGWRNFSLKKCYIKCLETKRGNRAAGFTKLYLIFHSIEIVSALFLLAVISGNIYLLAIAFSTGLHLLMDQVGNDMGAGFYFLFWRARKGFLVEKLLPGKGPG